MHKGVVIGGTLSRILVREKSQARLAIGEVVAIECHSGKILAQVIHLDFGSSLSRQTLEMMSGIQLEEGGVEFADKALRYYTLAVLKPLVHAQDGRVLPVKTLPAVFSPVREVRADDIDFLTTPEHPLLLGYLRSGNTVMEVPVYGDACQFIRHHVLVAATTGRGKSNLTSCLLWNVCDRVGMLVLDPHDEYYGRNRRGLKDHPKKKTVYYTSSQAPPGARTLRIHISCISPSHLEGCLPWSDPQKEALAAYAKKYKEHWIEAILLDRPVDGFHENTLAVVKRRIKRVLSIRVVEGELVCHGVFTHTGGLSTVHDVLRALEERNIVILDTSSFASSTEILVGSIFTSELFDQYRQYKMRGELDQKPVVGIVVEEAPRVLGKQALERGPNVFSSIAREGRKFGVGILAITQLPSLIPRDILANMNTKIVLGLEMKPERTAIIESAAQDLSEDDKHIASLGVGEALVTTHLLPFATPLRVPLFEDIALTASSASQDQPKRHVHLHGLGIGPQ